MMSAILPCQSTSQWVHCKLYNAKATYETDVQSENNKMCESAIVRAHTLRKRMIFLLDEEDNRIGKPIAFVVYENEQ